MNVFTNKNLVQRRLIVVILLLFAFHAYGRTQSFQLSGIVSDASDGEPLPGVTVQTQSKVGTVTDLDGHYVLQVTKGDQVSFSYLGMLTQTVKIDNQQTINIALENDLQALDEVVVVGYGTVKKSDVTGALARIGEKEIESMPVQNALQAMQGKMAGVDITSNERPGEIGNIRIRGERSLNATNDPLYVVDGIPMQGVGIENLNPSDIASIDVLKDASATAIYGSRGANGVVIVTTKKGHSGKMSLNYSGKVSFDKLYDRTTMMNSAEWLEYSRRAKSWGQDYIVTKEQDQKWFAADPVALANIEKGWVNGSWDGSLVPTYDWTAAGKQNGLTHEHTISASGGTDKMQSYASFGYLDQKGTQPGQSYERITGRVSTDIQATDWFKMGVSLNATFGSQEYGYDFRKSATGADDLYHVLQAMLPHTQPYTADGEFIPNPGGDANIINPIREAEWCLNQRENIRVFGSFYGELGFGKIFKALDGLKYRIQYGPDYRSGRTGIADPSQSINGGGNNVAQYNTDIKYSWTLDNLLYYDKSFGLHDLGLTFLQSASAYHNEGSTMRSFVTSEKELWYHVGSSSNIQSYDSYLTESQLESYMVRANYGFAQKYLLTVSGRWDGASQMAEGHQWDFFPSAALAWRMEQEDFMQNVTWVNQLKPRLGYGVTGNSAIDPYKTLGGVVANFYHFGGTTAVGMVANDPSLAASNQAAMANKQLSWEKTTQINLGVDFSLFNGRIGGAIDLYQSKTKDLLMLQAIPALTGYLATWANVGSTENKGIDIVLNTVNVKTKDFIWLSALTFSAGKNKITALANGAKENLNEGWIVGEPIGAYYDYVYDGIWKTSEATEAATYGRLPGQIKVKDISGPDGVPDGKIDQNYDRQVLGSRLPDWSGGFQNTLTYKDFELSFFLFGRFGQKIQAGGETLSGRFAMRQLDYWVAGTNENARYYAPGDGGESGDTYRSALNYEDASYIKLRNISLGYNFAPKSITKYGLSNLKVYVQCLNPGLIYSKVKYLDPDIYLDTNSTGSAFNRSFVVGLNVGF
jgi:TonB-linked SusC/RagA family outer membrane protein